MTPDEDRVRTDGPTYLWPFVAPYDPVEPVREDAVDFYLPASTPAPAIVFVHGGPVPQAFEVRPPEWPAYVGYAALVAQAGAVGVMFDHGWHSWDLTETASVNIMRTIESVRTDPRVDGDRVAVWAFSAGGVFMGPLLAESPPWLKAVAMTYPLCQLPDDVETTLTTPVDAIADNPLVPVLVTTVEHERDWIAETSAAFLAGAAAAGTSVDVIGVPGAEHGFETINDTDAARQAIRGGLAWVMERLA